MYLKSINNVIGYKNLPDGFSADFNEDVTYVVGANFKGKSTVGSLFNWCMTGTTIFGKQKEDVSNINKDDKKTTVDITFVDNYGIEHRLVREKNKTMYLMLDGKEIKQDMLVQYYKDTEIFLVAHNPYMFKLLEPKGQEKLLRRVIPMIPEEKAFNLLCKEEQEIIGKPIKNITKYSEERNEEIRNLEKEYNKNIGVLEILKQNALEPEFELEFTNKEEEIKQLQEKYDELLKNYGSSNLDDLKSGINKIDKELYSIKNFDLENIKKNYILENKKLENLNSEKTFCPTCKQEISNIDTKTHLKKMQYKTLEGLQNSANELKEKYEKLSEEKNEKIKIFNQLNNSDIEKISTEMDNLKSKIEGLKAEQKEYIKNKAMVELRHKSICEAKKNMNLVQNIQVEIKVNLSKAKKQKDIAHKLKILLIEKQKESINKYLDKVCINFSKVAKTTGEIKECCEIFYDGTEYNKLSKSQQISACLEISNVFNNLSGIKTPVFLDDAESITDIKKLDNIQMIISLVIKYNELEILDSYNDVLERKRKSINKEIEESSDDLLDIAA